MEIIKKYGATEGRRRRETTGDTGSETKLTLTVCLQSSRAGGLELVCSFAYSL